MARRRLLLVPTLTELEWVVRPQLEEWAEVATFDMPGVGEEPMVEPLDRSALVERALREVDGRGWDSYVVVCDGTGMPTGIGVAHARPTAVEAMALGHARLGNRIDGAHPTVNKEVADAFRQLAETNYRDFIRYGLTQLTHGSIGDELAERMLDRIPIETGRRIWNMLADVASFEDVMREVDAPLLLAKHVGCISLTEEGFEEAAAAFPEARTVAVPQAPGVSSEFAEALRDFCDELD